MASASELVEQGLADFERDDYASAIIKFDTALELDSSFAKAWCARGMVWHRQENREKANAHYDKAIELNPKYARAFFNRGFLKLENGDPTSALDDFDIALGFDQEARFYFHKGQALRELHRHLESIAALTTCLQFANTDMERAASHTERGISNYDAGNKTEALTEFDNAIGYDADRLWAISWKGRVRFDLQRYDVAADTFTQVIRKGTPSAYDFHCRAAALYCGGKYEDALRDYDQAIQLDPSSADLHFDRGLAYAQLNDHPRAIDDFNKAIELNPQLTQAYRQLALSRRKLGHDYVDETDMRQADGFETGGQ